MVALPFAVDLSRPLVFQVGHLGEAYQEWIHQPIVTKESPRFFQNDYCEILTRTVWWVVPLIWLPIFGWNEMVAIRRGLPLLEAVVATVVGILFWSLLEYTLHRFLFHMKTSSYWGNTIHYIFHGCHHKHPQDSYRLVFPPAGAFILSLPLWTLVKILCSHSLAPAVSGGVLLGYVIYDVTHYYLHHGRYVNEITRQMKKYHLNHHFKSQTDSFGITSALWDWVFGTLPTKLKKME